MVKASLLVVGLALASSILDAATPASKVFDSAPYSQSVTGCDRLVAHPEDPFKVAAGVDTKDVDFAAAIAACQIALDLDPENPRLRYQLARALTYAGQVKKALPLIEKAAAQHYPQAMFVTGYLYLEGFAGAPKDPCRAADLLRESGEYGRMAGILGFAAYAREGRFKGCAGEPDNGQIVAWLDAARPLTTDYYHGLLIDALVDK